MKLLDQRQLGGNALLYLSGNALRPAHEDTLRDQLTQILVGIVTLRHDFLGVLVTQFIQAEIAQPRDAQGFIQQGRGVEPLQFVQGTQVLLAIAQPPPAQLGDAGIVMQRSEHVMQRLAGGHVHTHIAAGHHGNGKLMSQRLQREVALHLIVAQQVTHAQPKALLAQPLELQAIGVTVLVIALRQPDQQAALQVKDHIAQCNTILALGAAPPRHADKARQFAVRRPRRHQRHQAQPFLQHQFTADD